jgi:hypothetical protein
MENPEPESREAKVKRLVTMVRRGMYRNKGDCPCDVCLAHENLDKLAAMAKETR